MTPATAEPRPRSASSDTPDAGFLSGLDTPALKRRFDDDDEFLFLDEFLPADISRAFAARVPKLMDAVHRNFIPKHKKGGSVSRYTLDELAPISADILIARFVDFIDFPLYAVDKGCVIPIILWNSKGRIARIGWDRIFRGPFGPLNLLPFGYGTDITPEFTT